MSSTSTRTKVVLFLLLVFLSCVYGHCAGLNAWQDGSTDVVVVDGEAGRQATQWRGQVGRDIFWWNRRRGKEVLITVNNQTLSKRMVICPSGSLRFTDGADHTMSSEELAMLPLEPGKNMATYHVPALEVTIHFDVFLITSGQKLVITDVDGTITREDVMGFVLPSVVGITHHQPGVVRLLSEISQRGYQVVYLTARSMALHEHTRNYIFNLLQEVGGSSGQHYSLPDGPVFHLPRDLISSISDPAGADQKTAILFALWQCLKSHEEQDINEVIRGAYGNNAHDLMAYSRAGISNIFIVNTVGELLDISSGSYTSYSQQVEHLDQIFPRLV